MRVRDLGALAGPVVLFGGPYSNLPATRALLDEAGARGIPPQSMICTGDVVAYCAQPAGCVALLRAAGCPVVAGNCERQLAARAPDCGCGFAEGSACDRLSAGWFAHADAGLDAAARDWMAALADVLLFRHCGRRYAVLHGGATDIARFVWPVDEDAVFAAEFAALEAVAGPVDAIVAGHCGLAFVRAIGARTWINAGAIGMPPNDGRPQTRWVLLDRGVAEIRRLEYDARAAQAAMRAAGLTQGYDAALTGGYWPSEEVLPPALRASG